MLTKLNDYSLITTYIEALLESEYVPTLKVLEPDMWVAKDSFYIVDNSIVKSLKTQRIENYKYSANDFEYIDYYEPWSHQLNISTNYVSPTKEYSMDVHEQFGEYLRAWSNLNKVNVMPYYNCFSGRIVEDITFDSTFDNEKQKYVHVIDDEADTNFNYYIVPIKLGKSYTIGLDFDGIIEMKAAFFHGEQYIQSLTETLDDLADTFKRVSNPRFKDPFVYSLLSNDAIDGNENLQNALDILYAFERNLRLVIKVSKSNQNPLVIVEGDYSLQNNISITRDNFNKFLSNPCEIIMDFNGVNENTVNKLVGPLSLFRISIDTPIAFSNRLFEFIIGRAITSADDNSLNISRIQNAISSDECIFKNGLRYKAGYQDGEYDPHFQNFIYHFGLNTRSLKDKYDLDGFVNKDIETLLR